MPAKESLSVTGCGPSQKMSEQQRNYDSRTRAHTHTHDDSLSARACHAINDTYRVAQRFRGNAPNKTIAFVIVQLRLSCCSTAESRVRVPAHTEIRSLCARCLSVNGSLRCIGARSYFKSSIPFGSNAQTCNKRSMQRRRWLASLFWFVGLPYVFLRKYLFSCKMTIP